MRSWSNFPAASASDALRSLSPAPSIVTSERAGVPSSACSASSRCASSTMAMIMAPPGGSLSASPSSSPVSTFFLANLPTRPPTAPPTATEASIGGANSPTSTPTPPPQPRPLRPRWSAVWVTVTWPSLVRATRMTPSDRIGGALDRGNEIVEVGLRGIGSRIRSQDQVESVGHARTRFSEGGRQPILSPVPGGGASSVPDEPAHTSRQALTPPESESTGANTAGEAVSEPTFASDLADVTAVLSTLVTPTDTVSDDCGRAHHRRRPGDRASDHAGPSHSSWSDGHVSLLRSPHRRRRGAPGSGFDRWR